MNNFMNPANPISPVSPLNPANPLHPLHPLNPLHKDTTTFTEVPAKDSANVADPQVFSGDVLAVGIIVSFIVGFIFGKITG